MKRRCSICGGEQRLTTHAGTSFHECDQCGYAVLAGETGRREYWAPECGSLSTETYWSEAKRRYFDSALELLATMTAGRRLVDIGGGVGFFAERALRVGWDAYSLDVSPVATERAATRVGRERALLHLPKSDAGTFDVATLWCVVAHTLEPKAVLGTAVTALRQGGFVWITTPNFRFQKPYAGVRSLLGRPLNFADHDHVGHFTVDALTRFLERAGFADVRYHFRGITETCVATGSDRRGLVRGKQLWNRIAFAAAEAKLPTLTSELQVTARLARETSATPT